VIFRRELAIRLMPIVGPRHIPFEQLLAELLRVELDPTRCRARVEALLAEQPSLAAFLDPAAIPRGDVLLRDAALFPSLEGWGLGFLEGDRFLGYHLDDELEAIGELLRLGATSDSVAAFREAAEALGEDVLAFLTRPGAIPASRWPRADRPGIFRREHASLLVRSETTSVLIDPIGMQIGLPNISRAPMSGDSLPLDAIAITHSHSDHFHLPSLLAWADPATRLLVPEVPRTNLLTAVDFADAGRAFGMRAEVVRWHQTVTVGDIAIDALPFYGEQPTRDAPGPPDGVRSWGNCYLFRTPQWSAAVLVDSGADPSGHMDDVAREIRARFGPVDLVLACLRTFRSPFFGGLPTYWAVLPFERLRELHAQLGAGTLPSTTAGPAGVASFCAAVGARWFAPYANGFEGVGAPISDVGWGEKEPSEAALLGEVERRLAELGAATRTIAWNPGDAVRVSSGELVIDTVDGRGSSLVAKFALPGS
jgi:glyoxylase-like metal-dependent hydrolase (beta-lactamase superfamily II)